MSPSDRNLIVDCQVHAYERDRPGRPWAGELQGPPEVTGEQMVAAMDEVGVDGALLVSPWTMYRFDPSYALEVHAKHPGRFGLIRPFDTRSEHIVDEMAQWAATPGAVGARVLLTYEPGPDPEHAGLHRTLRAAAYHGLPVNVLAWDRLELLAELAARNPDTQFVLDHVGLTQPFEPPVPARPFADLSRVLSLASLENVAIKISGACTLSHEPFPYPDIWDPLARIFDAYGFERCMWGTDWTRATALLTYREGVDAFRLAEQLSETERAALMGSSLMQIYHWKPEA
ncbi:MAG: hypothetical protein CMQ49_11730 [Gammaproteobacteria bacterium]|nr:hypothetical protein [Gammaproteobacteria bacterium]